MLQSFLFKITDHRRKQGRRYELGHILLFTILAILSGADSYRKVQKFIVTHYDRLDEIFELNWKRMPAHTTIRDIIQGTSGTELEQSFRQYSQVLAESDEAKQFIGCDGKVLRGSFDHFQDQKAIQILSAFVSDSHLILAHEEIAAKTNEIPTAQTLMEQLGLAGYIFTFDALHCQKKR
jgi:pullulanase/glycogen debranching enzyme